MSQHAGRRHIHTDGDMIFNSRTGEARSDQPIHVSDTDPERDGWPETFPEATPETRAAMAAWLARWKDS